MSSRSLRVSCPIRQQFRLTWHSTLKNKKSWLRICVHLQLFSRHWRIIRFPADFTVHHNLHACNSIKFSTTTTQGFVSLFFRYSTQNGEMDSRNYGSNDWCANFVHGWNYLFLFVFKLPRAQLRDVPCYVKYWNRGRQLRNFCALTINKEICCQTAFQGNSLAFRELFKRRANLSNKQTVQFSECLEN